MTTVKSTKKVKPSIVRSFRIIDYHIYDQAPKKEDSDSDEELGSYNSNEDNKEFIIQMFGINEKGETCCIYVNDFKPFFYIRVGDDWNQYKVNSMIKRLQESVNEYYKNSLVSFKLVDHHKLYGFSGGKKHQFVRITFKNVIAMNKYKNLWYSYEKSDSDGGYQRIRKSMIVHKTELELYESNIPPLLRYFHVNDISPSGWISVNTSRVTKVEIKTTTCKYEYISSLKHVLPLPEKETSVPYKICSYDIEASSSHGDFPLPVKTYKRLTTQLVDVFLKQSQFLNNDEDKGKSLLHKMLLASFGYSKFDDIDLVYPKLQPSRGKVEKLIDNIMNKSLDKAKKEVEEDNSDLIKIDILFESMKESHQNNVEGSCEATGQQNDTTIEPTMYGKKYEKKIKINKNTTVMNVLLDNQYERDDKIKILDEVLTLSFPRLKGDEVTFIGSTFMNYGTKEPYLNHCLVVGSCDDIDGSVIESGDTEKDVLLKWTELIQKENPDIIIGYNIFGFDYEFMFRRALENHCEREFLLLSRKMNDICANEEKGTGKMNLEHTKLQIASGEYDLRYARMVGRLQIDMYAYFRRDFNLSSYKLDDVAGQFISDSVKKIEQVNHKDYGDITELYSNNLMGLHKGDFIHIEITGFTTDYYKDGQKFRVLDIELTEM